MYFYGITACDLSHLSHARAAVNFIVLFRLHRSTYTQDFAGGLPLELPNPVVCRVDALEAELIATKKSFRARIQPSCDLCKISIYGSVPWTLLNLWTSRSHSNGSVPEQLAQQHGGSAAHNT